MIGIEWLIVLWVFGAAGCLVVGHTDNRDAPQREKMIVTSLCTLAWPVLVLLSVIGYFLFDDEVEGEE